MVGVREAPDESIQRVCQTRRSNRSLRLNENSNASNSQNSSSVTNLIQSIKSKQIAVNKDRERRSNSIFGVSSLNNKPSLTNLHKNPTIKNIRALNNDLIGSSNSRSESSNKIDAGAVNDKSPVKNFINLADNFKISKKINGKTVSSISTLIASKNPVQLYKNISMGGSSIGNNAMLKYNKQY